MVIYAEWKYLVLKKRGETAFILTIPDDSTISQNTWSKRFGAFAPFFCSGLAYSVIFFSTTTREKISPSKTIPFTSRSSHLSC
jgi:hypothetical protein